METVPVYVNFRMGSRAWGRILPGIVLLFVSLANATDPVVLTNEQRREIEQALPAKAQVQPAKPRRLLIFSRNVGYGGHRSSRAHASEAFTLMGQKTGAFETIISEDPAVFECKVQRANEAGIAVLLVGLMEPVHRYPEATQACLFARSIVARLFGNFVLFSPSFDSEFMDLANEVGRATREATAVHLVTQHPGTPWNQPIPTFSTQYYDQPYLDFVGVQTGHNAGNRNWCAHHAIEWNLYLYRHEPHKPVINLEAMYDAQGKNGWQAVDARTLAWRTRLSGAMGHTYGAGDLPPKVPQGNGAVWKWVTDPEKYDYWKKALQWESAFQMQHLHDFLAAIEWWRLEPAHDLIRNQPDDVTCQMVLAKSAAGDLAVAYMPNNKAIEIDVSVFPASLSGRWFDPVHCRYISIPGRVENTGSHRFTPPADGDWVLLLQRHE